MGFFSSIITFEGEMASLKTVAFKIAGLLDSTPAVLNERQRALVRHGLVALGEGLGPGSGVKANPKTLALFLIAILCTDSPANVGTRTCAMAQAPATAPPKCGLTGKKTFLEALETALGSERLLSRVVEIGIARVGGRAYITHKFNGKNDRSEFNAMLDVQADFHVWASLKGRLLRRIVAEASIFPSEERTGNRDAGKTK